MKEQALVNWTVSYICLRGHYAWRNNAGKLPIEDKKTGKKRFIKVGEKGLPDVLGYHRDTGQLIAIECKIDNNKLSPAQEERLQHMKNSNVIAHVVRTTQDVENLPI